MLFFKPKQSYDEILPPPPPSEMEMQEEFKDKPKFFDEIIDHNGETFPEAGEFNDFVENLSSEPNSKKSTKKGNPVPLEKIQSSAKDDIDFKDTFHGYGMSGFGDIKDYEDISKTKPKEVLEAQEEIENAINKIRKEEKPSFFRKFFPVKQKTNEYAAKNIGAPKFPQADNISTIQDKINNAREALAKSDLETAKKIYIEVMQIYNKTNPQEQSEVYKEIKELYFERKSAEG